jgi:hypothetical protein
MTVIALLEINHEIKKISPSTLAKPEDAENVNLES